MHLSRDSLYILYLSLLLSTSLGFADESHHILTADARKTGVERNIGFVEKLIQESAAAKQILQSDNAEARTLRKKAIAHLDEARAAEASGDAEAVVEALKQAKQAIFKAMRLVGGKSIKDKRQENYKKKLQSLESLLAAHKRIRIENEQEAKIKASQEITEIEAYTQTRLQKSQTHYDKGELKEARDVLNTAYLSLKLSLVKLRDGKTLVRSLHFETKKDEYHYELRRNDTHNMLINTVLKEKLADPRLGKLMNVPLKEAAKQRVKADQLANNENYEEAIKTLEISTKHIIRAIRMAGIFIPG